MLSYAAEFPLRTDDPKEVLDCIAVWLKGSPFRVFSVEQIEKIALGEVESISKDNQTLEIISLNGLGTARIGMKHTAVDRGVIYSTTIVSQARQGAAWVSIRTDRASINPQISLRDAKKPQIIKILLANIGGGLDGELWTQDEPHVLSDTDNNMAIRLINGDSSNHLPTVYVSRTFRDELEVDAGELARQLGGMAHVLVEPSRDFSRAIQPFTNSRNAYGGAVAVYLPTGSRSLLIPNGESEWEIRQRISQVVRDSLLTRLPMHGFSWSDIEADKSRRNIEELKEAGSTDIEAFVREFDAENQALKDQNAAQKEEISKLKSELLNLNSQNFSRPTNSASKFMVQEYFPGETQHIFKDAIASQMNAVPEESRRFFVLKELFDQLEASDEFDKRRSAVKELLSKSDKLDSRALKVLENFGFSITSDGKHHKMIYFGDGRLTFVMAKTGSDWRGPKNFASEVVKRTY